MKARGIAGSADRGHLAVNARDARLLVDAQHRLQAAPPSFDANLIVRKNSGLRRG